MIAWLAAQEWCNGKVGMFGTSYSGFNSLQLACERPPGLGAVFSIYSSDDRWTDDVHWRGGALKLVDLVDYCHYMTPMCVLPPVPRCGGRLAGRVGAAAGDQRALGPDLAAGEHARRLLAGRLGAARRLPVRVRADRGARRCSSRAGRTATGTTRSARSPRWPTHGVPHRLLAGPWAHADPKTAMPGPRIDLDVEMAAWFDRWLRSDDGAHDSGCDVFVRTSTVPEPDLDLHEGYWVSLPSVPPTRPGRCRSPGARPLRRRTGHGHGGVDRLRRPPAVGPVRRPAARRRPLADLGRRPAVRPVVGHPRARLRISVDQPLASLSVKLCDVFPDGTSALVSRGTLDLTFRDGVHGPRRRWCPARSTTSSSTSTRARSSGRPATRCGSASPAPTGRTRSPRPHRSSSPCTPGRWRCRVLEGLVPRADVHRGRRALLGVDGRRRAGRSPTTSSGGTTTAHTHTVSEYDTPTTATPARTTSAPVTVDRRTWDQTSHAVTTYDLGLARRGRPRHLDDGHHHHRRGLDVAIDTVATLNGEQVSHRTWRERIPRVT